MKYEQAIREDFESRLIRVELDFIRNAGTPVMQKLIELNELCTSDVFSMFYKIDTCGFDSLEKLENLLSIVGNFYDDSFYDVVWEIPPHIMHFPKPTSYPHIIQVNDDKPKCLTEDIFCEVIQWYIDRGIKHQQQMAELGRRSTRT